MKFIGFFSYVTHQEAASEADRRHGEFNLMVDAALADEAIRMFRERIVEYRKHRQFFEGMCKIFLNQFIEFDAFPTTAAVMFSYKSVAGDPMMPFIRCTVPTDQQDWCSIHEWKDNWPEIDGQMENLFIEFSGPATLPKQQ